MRIVVFDRELHEPLTIVNIPAALMPRPDGSNFMPKEIRFAVEDREIGYRTPIVPMDRPTSCSVGRVTSITLEPVCRSVPAGRNTYRSEVLFWYAYADDPELALLLRAAFLPGQVNEMQMREKESEAKGILRGFGIALGMEDPDDLF